MVGGCDQSEGVGTLPQRMRRDFSAVGYDEDDYDGVLERARQKCGRVAIANSDAGGDAYAHLAIGEAARAVRELTG